MKKYLKSICLLLVVIAIVSTVATSANATTKSFKLSKEIGEFSYNGSTYGIKRIYSTSEQNKVFYCLEINNNYPNNETFDMVIKSNDQISALLFCGFPKVENSSLGLKTDDEAYVATQIALWAIVENFNVDKIKTPNKNLTNAVKSIYNTATRTTVNANYELYSTNSSNIQDIVTLQLENTNEEGGSSIIDDTNENKETPEVDTPNKDKDSNPKELG